MRASILKKEAKIKEISQFLNTAKSFIIFEYQGLKATTISEFRKKLNKSGSKLQVLKNNILEKSLDSANISVPKDILSGPNAIIMGFEDEISIFKQLVDVQKEFDFIKIKGGYLNGSFISQDVVKQLSTIPSREGLYGMFLSCLTSPLRSFLYAIKAVSEQKTA